MRRNHLRRFSSWWFFIYRHSGDAIPQKAQSINRAGSYRPASEAYKPLPSTFFLNSEQDGSDDDALWDPNGGTEV
jgi:hypothetical protein